VTKVLDNASNQMVIADVRLLNFDRENVIGKITLFHREEKRVHYISIEGVSYALDQVFEGWSAKVALDQARKCFEENGALIALGGTLVYASYSGMCHDMGGGYAGYNYKDRKLGDMTRPEMISTFSQIEPDKYNFVSTVDEQNYFINNFEEAPQIIQKLTKRKSSKPSFMKHVFSFIFGKNSN